MSLHGSSLSLYGRNGRRATSAALITLSQKRHLERAYAIHALIYVHQRSHSLTELYAISNSVDENDSCGFITQMHRLDPLCVVAMAMCGCCIDENRLEHITQLSLRRVRRQMPGSHLHSAILNVVRCNRLLRFLLVRPLSSPILRTRRSVAECNSSSRQD